MAARLLGVAARTIYQHIDLKESEQKPEKDPGEFKD
jgi:hypothetical protein